MSGGPFNFGDTNSYSSGYGYNSFVNVQGGPQILQNMATVSNVATLGVGIMRLFGQGVDQTANTVGAVEGFGSTIRGSKAVRDTYGNIAQGNANQSALYNYQTADALHAYQNASGVPQNGPGQGAIGNGYIAMNTTSEKQVEQNYARSANWSPGAIKANAELNKLNEELQENDKELIKEREKYAKLVREDRRAGKQERLLVEIGEHEQNHNKLFAEMQEIMNPGGQQNRQGPNGQPGQNQNNARARSPEEAANYFAQAMYDAQTAPVGSDRRNQGFLAAYTVLKDLTGPDGTINFPEGFKARAGMINGQPVDLTYDKTAHFKTREDVLNTYSALFAKSGLGTAINAQEVTNTNAEFTKQGGVIPGGTGTTTTTTNTTDLDKQKQELENQRKELEKQRQDLENQKNQKKETPDVPAVLANLEIPAAAGALAKAYNGVHLPKEIGRAHV